mgnify:CR=1 FL=1|tara:strand:- start:3891 stop:5939 length:2049 start_codon:yes stop_codon:yes gene_type:complete
MKNNWSSREANKFIEKYNKVGVSKDLALRIYSTQLLGKEKKLVLHGGGNTSLKTVSKNIFGKKINVMHIKGSGWDMSDIDYPGLPAVELDPLLETVNLKKLDDFSMVNLQRKNLLDSNSPNPSVETLLHAFIPHKYVDHTHANSILGLIDQPNDIEICKKVFGDKVGIVPYVIPGFELAIKANSVFQKNNKVIGLILLNHGIFSFGSTAKESYERMIQLVNIAERYLSKYPNKILKNSKKIKKNIIKIEDVFPLIRKNLSSKIDDNFTKWVLDFRSNKKILSYLNNKNLNIFSQSGPITPDHVIRIKPKPLILKLENISRKELDKKILNSINIFKKNYIKYFNKNKKFLKGSVMLDTNPRIILIPGLGIVGIGRTSKEAKIASDLAECTIDVISQAESFGKFKSISEKEIFKMEYWSLEQAKLKNLKRKHFSGNVVLISGGCGEIGLSTAESFLKEGAEVILLEKEQRRINDTPTKIKKFVSILKCDVTNTYSLDKAIKEVIKIHGGIDILVCNAGAPWQGKMAEVSKDIMQKSLDLNLLSHHHISQHAVKVFLKQNTGGQLLYNISKQSINPGRNFGPYGIAKAATLFMMRQYTLEYAKFGVRANGVNPDRIKTNFGGKNFVKERAKARGVKTSDYLKSNLLNTEVKPKDVADAFVLLAKSKKTTGDVLTVDGGNITATLR